MLLELLLAPGYVLFINDLFQLFFFKFSALCDTHGTKSTEQKPPNHLPQDAMQDVLLKNIFQIFHIIWHFHIYILRW